jgi:hypothetical protein
MIADVPAGQRRPVRSVSDIPALDVRQVHLAGITDQEFDLEFVRGMKARDYRLSADMQSFVRQVDPTTRRISFGDVADKHRDRRFWTW